MGVPVSFLAKHNPDQFEIVGITRDWSGQATKSYPPQTQISANGDAKTVSSLHSSAAILVESPPPGKTYYEVNGQLYVKTYARILIRRR